MKNHVTLYQINTLAGLMAGLYEGTITIKDLLSHGDLGIGTIDMIDGELIVLDGKAYVAHSDGSVEEVSEETTVPYAAVVNHRADFTFEASNMTDTELKHLIEAEYLPSQNLFASFKMHGTFSQMHVRMVPKSELGQRFADVAAHQPEFTEEDVTGTIVGVWTPMLFHGVSVAGYHLHFLSDDHQFGGHILDFAVNQATVEVGQVDHLQQDFPVHSRHFKNAHLDVKSLIKDIEASE
jgi:acetolactate decarboxylase